MCIVCFFFFKQKTAYEMRISDWSSDVCSSDLRAREKALSTFDMRSIVLRHIELYCRLLGHRAPMSNFVGAPGDGNARPGEWPQLALDAGISPMRKQIGRASCRERVCQYV